MVAGPALAMNASRHSDFPQDSGPRYISDLLHAQSRRQADESDQKLDSASFYLDTLPGLDPESTLKMFAGHIPSAPASDPDSDSHLFFFLARNKHIADRERFVIWLNGGPGCSSFDGALMEVGPFRLEASEKEGDRPSLKEVTGAWNEYSNVLFLDQPAGTGYSYVSTNNYVHQLPIAADHVVEFLRKFYLAFPEFQEMDTYIAGESFAGQYIPYTADAILKSSDVSTPLKGLVIGNGWMDPWAQYQAYLPFAYENDLLEKGSATAKPVEDAHKKCQERLEELGKGNVPVHENGCEDVLNSLLESTMQTINGQKMCINTYDVRLTDKYPSCGMNWPPDLSMLYDYLPRDEVKKAFHASKKEGGWIECSGQVGGNFNAFGNKPSVELLPRLLEQIPILMFAGDQDLICNWLGLSNMLDDMDWNGEKGLGNAPVLDWTFDGRHAGSWQTARNLSFVKFADASHMAPFDWPMVAHDMLLRFQHTDFMSAAGSAAKVPSRVGDQQESIIGETLPNGTVITPTNEAQKATAGAVSEYDSSTAAYYNVGSAAVVIFLLAAVAGIFYALRRKVRQEQTRTANLGAYEAGGYSPPGTSSGSAGLEKPSKRMHQHKRGQDAAARGISSTAHRDAGNGDEHELEHLVRRDGEANSGEEASGHVFTREEDVFSLGDSDEDGESKATTKHT